MGIHFHIVEDILAGNEQLGHGDGARRWDWGSGSNGLDFRYSFEMCSPEEQRIFNQVSHKWNEIPKVSGLFSCMRCRFYFSPSKELLVCASRSQLPDGTIDASHRAHLSILGPFVYLYTQPASCTSPSRVVLSTPVSLRNSQSLEGRVPATFCSFVPRPRAQHRALHKPFT